MQKIRWNESLLDKLLKREWIITGIYWKYSDNVVYDQDKEKAKNMLYSLYGYKDIFEVLPPELDDQKTIDHVRTLMSIDIFQNPETTSLEAKKDKII